MKIGDTVRLNEEVHRFLGKRVRKTAKIEAVYSDIEGGVRLDKALAGFRSWNVSELELVKAGKDER